MGLAAQPPLKARLTAVCVCAWLHSRTGQTPPQKQRDKHSKTWQGTEQQGHSCKMGAAVVLPSSSSSQGRACHPSTSLFKHPADFSTQSSAAKGIYLKFTHSGCLLFPKQPRAAYIPSAASSPSFPFLVSPRMEEPCASGSLYALQLQALLLLRPLFTSHLAFLDSPSAFPPAPSDPHVHRHCRMCSSPPHRAHGAQHPLPGPLLDRLPGTG